MDGISFMEWLQQHRGRGNHCNGTISDYFASTRPHCPSTACTIIFLILPMGYAVLLFLSWRRMRDGCCSAPLIELDIGHIELGHVPHNVRQIERAPRQAAEIII